LTLSLEARAFYRELIDYCIAEGPFPADIKFLAGIAHCTEAEAERLWTQVSSFFTKTAKKEFTNKKAKLVRDSIQGRKEKQSNARTLRVKSESTKTKPKVESKLGEGDGEGEGDVDVTEGSVRETNPTIAPDDREFHEFIGVFLGVGVALSEWDIATACREWVSLDDPSRRLALAGAKREYRDWQGRETQFVPRPRTYLRERQWERKAIAPPRTQSASKAERGQAEAVRRFREEQ